MNNDGVVKREKIPEDLVAIIRGGEILYFKRRKVNNDVNRCRDCKFFGKGHATINSWYESDVCKLRPKHVKDSRFKDQELYYHTNPSGRACDKFEIR